MERLADIWRKSFVFYILNKIELFIKDKTDKFISGSFSFPFISFVLEYYLYLFIFLIPFLSSGKIAIGISIAFFLWFLDTFLSKDKKFFESLNSFVILYVIFLLINLVATFFSPYLIPAIKGYLKFLVYFAIFLVFKDVFKDDEKIKRAFFSILLSTFFLSLYCLYQWIIKVPPLARWEDVGFVGETVTRVYGTLQNPNLLGGYLIGVMPFILSTIYIFRLKSIPVITTILTFLSIIWTYSRGAYLGFLVSMALYFIMIFKIIYELGNKNIRKILLVFLFIVILAGVGIFSQSSYFQRRILSAFTLWGHSSNATRIVIWERSFKIFKDFFWTGIGLGNDVFRRVYAFYMEPKFTALASYNLFLEVGIEGGIFALIVFLLMIYYLYRKFFIKYSTWDLKHKILGISAISSITAPLFHGLVDTIWYRPYPQIIFWFSVAILLNLFEYDGKIKEILLFNLGGLGDQILFLPVVKGVIQKFNPQRLKIITEKRGRKIFDIIGIDVEEFNPKEKLSFSKTLYLMAKLRIESYDLSISTGKSPFIPIFMYFVGAPIRVGYIENPLSFLYTHKASSKRNEYMGKVHFRLLKSLDESLEFSLPEIDIPENIKSKVKDKIVKYSLEPFSYILIHPGISKMSIRRGIDRRWGSEKWKELVERLKQKGLPYVIVYGPEEEETIEELKKLIKDGLFILPDDLDELIGWIYYSKAMICLDSAPLHLGVALKKPLVALFGPTNPKEIVPEDPKFQIAKIDLSCEPCLWDKRNKVCDNLSCMDIPVDLVWEKLLVLIES